MRMDKLSVKQADRPDFVTASTLARFRYDSHSSRRLIAQALKLPTRTLREPPQRVPIWDCSRWRLPRFTVTEYARLCGPVPRLIPCGFRRTAVNRHPALWSPDLPPADALRASQRLSWPASRRHCNRLRAVRRYLPVLSGSATRSSTSAAMLALTAPSLARRMRSMAPKVSPNGAV